MQTDATLPHVAFVLEAVEQAKELAARLGLGHRGKAITKTFHKWNAF